MVKAIRKHTMALTAFVPRVNHLPIPPGTIRIDIDIVEVKPGTFHIVVTLWAFGDKLWTWTSSDFSYSTRKGFTNG